MTWVVAPPIRTSFSHAPFVKNEVSRYSGSLAGVHKQHRRIVALDVSVEGGVAAVGGGVELPQLAGRRGARLTAAHAGSVVDAQCI